jgi:hypothetical protein
LEFYGLTALSAVTKRCTELKLDVKFDKIEDVMIIHTYNPCIIREAVEVVKHHLSYNREDRYELEFGLMLSL